MTSLVVRRPSAAARIVACLVSGHRWDLSPRGGAGQMKCVRCGMVAEAVSSRDRPR